MNEHNFQSDDVKSDKILWGKDYYIAVFPYNEILLYSHFRGTTMGENYIIPDFELRTFLGTNKFCLF